MKDSLEIRNLISGYGKKIIVNDISFSITFGEIISIIGPNGAGKSTLLKSIFGLIPVKSGNILLKDNDITKYSMRKKAKMGFGYVLQGGEIFFNLTVKENLRMGLRNGNKKHFNEKLKEIYSIFPNLKELENRKGKFLSGGERQALAIGIILMASPKIFLMDEPSAGLTPSYVKNIIDTIKLMNEKFGITFLVVEQNVKEIIEISNRTIVLKNGKIGLIEKKPEKLLESDILENIFLK